MKNLHNDVLWIIIFLIFFATVFPAFAAEDAASTHAPLKMVSEIDNPQSFNIDFESYQRSIDDLYHLALMSTPNVDYGINSIIVDLNRKVAENPKNAESLMALGHVYRILGQPAEANRFYEKAMAIDPDNFHLNVFSALTNVRQEEFEKALDQLNHAVEINPADSYAWMARGRLLMMLRKNEEAAKSFEKVLEIQPENRQAAFGLSLVSQSLGQHEKALEILTTLQKKDPKNLLVRYHLGAVSFVAQKPREALNYWEELFKEGLRDVQFLFNLAIIYLESGKTEEAKNILNHLHFFFPRELDLELLMAETYRQMNLFKEAERHYRLVLAENPDYISAYVGLANVLEAQGNAEESVNVLKQAEERIKTARNLQMEQQEIQAAREEIFKLVSPDKEKTAQQNQTV